MGSTRFRNPRALSSALALLEMLQPRALGFLNRVDPMDSMSNLYIDYQRGLQMSAWYYLLEKIHKMPHGALIYFMSAKETVHKINMILASE